MTKRKKRSDYNKPSMIVLGPPNPTVEAAARRIVEREPDAETLLAMLGLTNA